MGIGLVYVIFVVVNFVGFKVSDIDLFEINEVFVFQYVYCCKKLELDVEKVNVNGGVIVIGYFLGVIGYYYFRSYVKGC